MDYSEMRFPAPLTVSELNSYIKDLLDLNPPLTDIYVKGEISNFKAHSSGHYYFSLKDEDSALKCVMFRSDAYGVPFTPENGMKIIAHGRVSAFVRDGAYQLYVNEMQPDGIGAMYIAVEQLKKKLEAEGLFEHSRKKELPKIPLRVGVVTSPTGAAVRDIINVAGRRFPMAEITVYPALVQGDGAIDSIAKGIEYFNKTGSCDVMIVGRGGGSIEDLWAFNSEKVARAVASSSIPVISAVGHETDFTVCDLVADKRAPTPSAAAELAVPDTGELIRKFNNLVERESAVVSAKIRSCRENILRISSSRALASPANTIADRRMALINLSEGLDYRIDSICKSKMNDLTEKTASLNALNPLAVLSRGYSALFREGGAVVKSTKDVKIGDELYMKLSDGEIKAEVTDVKETEK